MRTIEDQKGELDKLCGDTRVTVSHLQNLILFLLDEQRSLIQLVLLRSDFETRTAVLNFVEQLDRRLEVALYEAEQNPSIN